MDENETDDSSIIAFGSLSIQMVLLAAVLIVQSVIFGGLLWIAQTFILRNLGYAEYGFDYWGTFSIFLLARIVLSAFKFSE